MNKYFLHYRANSGTSIYDRKQHQQNPKGLLAFQFGENIIYIKDYLFEENGLFLFGGLDIFVKYNAKEKEEAKHGAKNLVESLLMLLSFTTLSYIDNAYLKSIISINKNKDGVYPVDFVEYIVSSQKNTSLTKIDIDNFRKIWEAFNKYERKDRILRAISWLRKGFNSKNIDQFICFMTGLEVLKGLAEEKLIEDKSNKPTFLKRWFTKKRHPGWSGIERIFADYLQTNEFKKIKKKRNQILHGFEKLDRKMVKDVDLLLPSTRKGLIYAISILLDLPNELMAGISEQKWAKYDFNRWQIIGGYFKEVDTDLARLIPDYPTVHTQINSSAKEIKESGEITTTENCTYDFLIPKEFGFVHESHEIWAENDSGISEVSAKVDTKSQSD